MKIGIVGYRRHARKHIDLIKKNYKNNQLVIFHPTFKSREVSNNFSDLMKCDCLIISSPTSTHLEYIKKLSEYNYKMPIYLEKPGFNSIKESYELEKLQSKFSLNITFGYHFPYESKIKKIKEIISSQDIGKIISIDLLLAKGISYSNWFQDDWRKQDKLAVAHTGLSHLLSIYYFLIDNDFYQKINSKVFFNNDTESFDNALAFSIEDKPILKAIFSWGSPLIKLKIQILTTNKLINLDEDNLEVRSPRDVFDINGNYVEPNITYSKKFKSEGIKPSMHAFFAASKNKNKFNSDLFQKGLKIGRICHSAEIIK